MKIRRLTYLLFCSYISVFIPLKAQNPTFKITKRDYPSLLVSNNANVFQATTPLAKLQYFLDVINLTNSNQDIIIKKTELLLNVITSQDKGLPSYCFGIFCRDAEVFADTVTFLPMQTVPLEFDFFEASIPGHSMIRYTISNKNNGSENLSVFMDYQGVVSVIENKNQSPKFCIFPNPSKGQFWIASDESANLTQAKIVVRDYTGKIVLEEPVNLDSKNLLPIESDHLSKGIYSIQIENQTNQLFHQRIIIE